MGVLEIIGGAAAGVFLMALEPGTIVALVAGIIVPALGFLGGAVWWFHKRIRSLEDADDEREAVVYGKENNPLNIGLVKEVKSLKNDFERGKEERQELREQQEEILERLESIDKKIRDDKKDDD